MPDVVDIRPKVDPRLIEIITKRKIQLKTIIYEKGTSLITNGRVSEFHILLYDIGS